MNVAYLLIGGNMGDRLANLQAAMAAIAQHCGTVTATSGIYETAAWGVEDQPAFLNQSLELHTELEAKRLLKSLLEIEISLGRLRDVKYGPRTIDIDILLYDNAIINEEGLKVPHPQLPYRRFALTCLADIAANVVHPQLHQTVAQLLADCTDTLAVHKYN